MLVERGAVGGYPDSALAICLTTVALTGQRIPPVLGEIARGLTADQISYRSAHPARDRS